jgi:hypothetical protein
MSLEFLKIASLEFKGQRIVVPTPVGHSFQSIIQEGNSNFHCIPDFMYILQFLTSFTEIVFQINA